IYTPLNQYHVVLEVEPRFQQSPEALRLVHVRTASGATVPLDALARWQRSTTPLAVNHNGQLPAATISFNLAPGAALGDAVEAIGRAEADLRMPATVRGRFAGAAQAF